MLIVYQRESNIVSYLQQMVFLVALAVRIIQSLGSSLSPNTTVDTIYKGWLGAVMDPVCFSLEWLSACALEGHTAAGGQGVMNGQSPGSGLSSATK